MMMDIPLSSCPFLVNHLPAALARACTVAVLTDQSCLICEPGVAWA